jgi:uncharacterized protein (TIGR02145 family)
MKKIILIVTLLSCVYSFAQVGLGTSNPVSSAALDVTSVTKGFLPPRMTYAQRASIPTPVAGLIIFCSDCGTSGELLNFNGTSWTNVVGASATFTSPSVLTQIGNEGDSPNALASVITSLQLASISGITGVLPSNELAYQAYIDANPNSFSSPATATEVNAMIVAVNSEQVLIQIGNEGDSPNTIASVITASQLSSIIGVVGVVPANISAYQAYIDANPALFSSPATLAEVNAMFILPDAPTSVIATAGYIQASVAFSAPVSNGGSAITGYTVTSSPGSFTSTGASSPLVVTGLTAGTAYTFTVVATNVAGNSVASAASTSVTPYTVPNAPTSVVATAGYIQASVAFTSPVSNGGSTITSYTVTSTPGSFTSTGATSPLVVTGLTAGTAYTFTVVATNVAGNSAASAASTSVTPYTVPNAPTSVVAIPGNTQTSVSFTAPVSNGGSAITGYTVTSSPGGLTKTGTSSPLLVTGLTAGTAYTFTAIATNIAGNSLTSVASASVTPAIASGSAVCNNTTITDVVELTSTTGVIWMDRNLGASRAATSSSDHLAYGCLYQWGRGNDGHASITWTSSTAGTVVNSTTTTLSSTDTPGDALFITIGTSPFDWRSTQSTTLWSTNGATNNNPCPTGFHIPTAAQYTAEFAAASPGYNITNAATAYSNGPSGGFKFTMVGARVNSTGVLANQSTEGVYWTNTLSGTDATRRYFASGATNSGVNNRSYGFSVRCIKD